MTQLDINKHIQSLLAEVTEEILYLLPDNYSRTNCVKALANAALHAAAAINRVSPEPEKEQCATQI